MINTGKRGGTLDSVKNSGMIPPNLDLVSVELQTLINWMRNFSFPHFTEAFIEKFKKNKFQRKLRK
jgi:hypothetical protein